MNEATKSAIKQVAMRASSRINNLYAMSYMDVHCKAGPWGTKHDDDVAAVIEEEVQKVFMVMRIGRRNK